MKKRKGDKQMHAKDIIKFDNWQVTEVKNGFLAMMAALRLTFENARRHRAVRIAGWVLIAALVLTLEWLIAARIEQGKAQALYAERVEQFKTDYLDQQDAARRGMPIDPKAELIKQENTEFARLISGLKLYKYGREDYITLGQCVMNRVLNPAYPGSIVEVIQHRGQWPGYHDTNEVTESTYALAASILDGIRVQERQPCSSDLTIADFGDKITLRNTMDYNRDTVTWRYGQ